MRQASTLVALFDHLVGFASAARPLVFRFSYKCSGYAPVRLVRKLHFAIPTMDRRSFKPPSDHQRFKEIYLIVRPEEKRELERALSSVVAPVYSTIQALGRGSQGGLSYGARPKRFFGIGRRASPKATFLPKTIFHLVVPEELVAPIVRAASEVLRQRGGPEDCGLGVAIVADIEEEIAIDGRAPASSRRRGDSAREAVPS